MKKLAGDRILHSPTKCASPKCDVWLFPEAFAPWWHELLGHLCLACLKKTLGNRTIICKLRLRGIDPKALLTYVTQLASLNNAFTSTESERLSPPEKNDLGEKGR